MVKALIFLLSVCMGQSIYDPNLYSLGSNLVVNPNFDNPVLVSGDLKENYVGSMPGWTCNTI